MASVLEQLREAPAHVREAPRPRQARRPGQILALVVAVLADADGPMRGCDVRDVVIARLGEEVSWSTVRNALSYATAHAEFGVMRIGWGLYEKPGRS